MSIDIYFIRRECESVEEAHSRMFNEMDKIAFESDFRFELRDTDLKY